MLTRRRELVGCADQLSQYWLQLEWEPVSNTIQYRSWGGDGGQGDDYIKEITRRWTPQNLPQTATIILYTYLNRLGHQIAVFLNLCRHQRWK